MEIRGIVEYIIFHNAENGYTVMIIDFDGEPVTLTGSFANPCVGIDVVAKGEFISSKYGKQFKAELISIPHPTSPESIINFLSSGLIKGIGKVTARNIVDTFKEDTLDIVENHPEVLTKIKGISKKKAVEIANSYRNVKAMQDVIMLLSDYNLSTNMAIKIYNHYQSNAKEIILKNPYKLVEDIEGIGFSSADSIASKMGFTSDNDLRIRAGIIHILNRVTFSSGSTFVLRDELINKVCELLGLNNEESWLKINQVLLNLKSLNIIHCFKQNDDEAVALIECYESEKIIAERLLALSRNKSSIMLDIETDIKEFERVNGIELHEKQKEAVIKAINSGVIVITGGPGTGKTTIIKLIVSILSKHRYDVSLVAPTGRASKKLSLATEKDAKTIHRLLGCEYSAGTPTFAFNKFNKLKTDVVIVDEVSMIDVFLMCSLVQAMRDGARIIMVGDKDQLPSVGAGNILRDIILSDRYEVVYLSRIYRQNDESLIITNAHRINNGEFPIIDNKSNDFFFLEKTDQSDILNNVLTMFQKRIPEFKGVSMNSIQILAPVKKGIIGTLNINSKVQELINPKSILSEEIENDGEFLRVGDRVIHTQNNYQITWHEYVSGFENKGEGVFNGDIGFIQSIDKKARTLVVEFEDGRIAEYTFTDAKQLALAYAISIHKSQGCEFDVVILPLSRGYKDLYTRNLLYTAITRAKKMLVIISDKHTLSSMINNDFVKRRDSMLLKCILEL